MPSNRRRAAYSTAILIYIHISEVKVYLTAVLNRSLTVSEQDWIFTERLLERGVERYGALIGENADVHCSDP